MKKITLYFTLIEVLSKMIKEVIDEKKEIDEIFDKVKYQLVATYECQKMLEKVLGEELYMSLTAETGEIEVKIDEKTGEFIF